MKKKKVSLKNKGIKFYFKLFLVVLLGLIFVCFYYRNIISNFCTLTFEKFKTFSSFELKQVIVKGHTYTKLSDINKKISLSQGMYIFDINLPETHKKILELPWIKKASIHRILPNFVIIHIDEKKPIAMWQKGKNTYYPLDEEGNKINDRSNYISNLILVAGNDAPKYTPKLLSSLEKYPQIKLLTKSAVWVNQRRWSLILSGKHNDIFVELPDTHFEDALQRLDTWQQENDILSKKIKRIDLRHPDKIIVRAHELKKER